MASETSDRPRLTAKGARTRARIVEEAAALIHERGVAATTLEDVKAAAEVSGSQLYHYFPDKDDLVQAVIDYHADAIVSRNRQVLGTANGVEAWRKMVIAAAKRTKAKGGCALGSLVGQLAESDPEARALIASGFDQWAAALGDGLRSLHAEGKLPPDVDPDDLAVTLLATLEGGLCSPRLNAVPARSKPRSIPSSPLPPADEPRPAQGRRNFIKAPRPGDAFRLDLDGTVIARRYVEADPRSACRLNGTAKEPARRRQHLHSLRSRSRRRSTAQLRRQVNSVQPAGHEVELRRARRRRTMSPKSACRWLLTVVSAW